MEKSNVFHWHKWLKETCMSKSQMKAMLITFFNIKGIVHLEFISKGQTVDQANYMEIMTWSREAVCRTKLWLNDCATSHKALSATYIPTHPPARLTNSMEQISSQEANSHSAS
jgi:hypothetical protein